MYERKDREEREAREALANIKIILAERDTLIRQRAADLEALNAVQALHTQAVDERDEARRQVEAMREVVEAARREMWQSMNLPIREAIERLDAIAVPSTEVEG